MKVHLGPLLLMLALCSCAHERKMEATPHANVDSMILRKQDFVTVKRWILKHGDRQTFSAMYNHNPHYAFAGVDAFLLPEGGQRNIDCDPRLSDFVGIVLRAPSAEGPRYATVWMVKEGLVVEDGGRDVVGRHWSHIVKIADGD